MSWTERWQGRYLSVDQNSVWSIKDLGGPVHLPAKWSSHSAVAELVGFPAPQSLQFEEVQLYPCCSNGCSHARQLMSSCLLLKCKWSCSGIYLACTSKVSFSGTWQVTKVPDSVHPSFTLEECWNYSLGGWMGRTTGVWGRMTNTDTEIIRHNVIVETRAGPLVEVSTLKGPDGWWWKHGQLLGRIKVTSSPLAGKSTPDTAASGSTCWWISVGLQEALSMWITTPRFLSDAWRRDNTAVIGLLQGRQSVGWTAAGCFLESPRDGGYSGGP